MLRALLRALLREPEVSKWFRELQIPSRVINRFLDGASWRHRRQSVSSRAAPRSAASGVGAARGGVRGSEGRAGGQGRKAEDA